MSFIDGTHDRPPEGPTNVYVKRHGQRFKAKYCFAYRRVTNIITKEELAELKTDPRYTVIFN